VVDLSAVRFCDSLGLSAFVDAHHRCTAAGGFLRLAAPTPFLLRVLAVVGLLRRLGVYETVRGACAGDPAAVCALPEEFGVGPADGEPGRCSA
jgi:anti-sigma B factor antagonist